MLETLVTIGSFQVRTLNVFEVIAFLAAGLIFWRRAKEENYPEARVFDAYLLSYVAGWVLGRFGYVIFNIDRFLGDPLSWLNIVQYPGVDLFFALLGASLYLVFFAKKQKWDAFEILDWWAQAVTMGLVWLNVGYFLAGTRFGHSTSLPWGVIFPGVFEKRHPVQLYFALFHAAMFKYLGWLEYNYRTFEWYRSGKKTAQTGFIFIAFLISYAVFSLVMSIIQSPVYLIGGFALDGLFYLALILLGIHLLLNRANRGLFSFKDRKLFPIKK